MVPPRALVAEDQPSTVRLTLTDGTVVVLERPTTRGDSLISAVSPETEVAVVDIRLLEVRRFSVARSLLLVIGVGLFGASWTAVARGADGGTSTPVPRLPKE